MVHGKTFIDPKTGKFLKSDELDTSDSNNYKVLSTKEPVIVSYEKMSKSKYNGADPAECIAKHGADATRAHILFQAPVSDVLNWDESKIVGIKRWLERVIRLTKSISDLKSISTASGVLSSMNEHEMKLHNSIQKLIRSITESLQDSLSLNTVISDYMKLSNLIEDSSKMDVVRKELVLLNLQKLVTILYPVVPSISEEAASILIASGYQWDQYVWPEIEPVQQSNQIQYQIFINGKMRFMHIAEDDFIKDEPFVIETLRSTPEGEKYLKEKELRKIIIKGKIISLVLKKD